jgi:glycosyltransferase involved in cell wall biosynthesis
MQVAEEVAKNFWLTGFEEVDHIRDVVTSYYSTTFWHTVDEYRTSRERGPVVYEYIDRIDPSITGADGISRLEELRDLAFSGGVDAIVASARVLEAEAKEAIGPDRVFYVPNGVDYEHYQSPRRLGRKKDLPYEYKNFLRKFSRVVGYFGALAPWLWYPMLRDLMTSRSDLGFVFIGPDYLGGAANLAQASNVLWLGPVDYRMLPLYASEFDVAIIPFEPGDIAKTTSPLKLFEYFALAKPVVVTTAVNECVVYKEVLLASTSVEFSSKIDEALKLAKDRKFKTIGTRSAKRLVGQSRNDGRCFSGPLKMAD